MPVNGARVRAIRELKGLHSQAALADLIGVSQPSICALEQGRLKNDELLLKVADALDCEIDFIYARGRFVDVDIQKGSPDLWRVASEMAFIFFVKDTGDQVRIERGHRVLGHEAAPITAVGWRHLSEQIERALGPMAGPSLRRIDGGKGG